MPWKEHCSSQSASVGGRPCWDGLYLARCRCSACVPVHYCQEHITISSFLDPPSFMDFEDEDKVLPSDAVMEYEEGFKLVCDSKSLLYLFGMSLDYSDELIGGGFKFNNPNAESSCGCGKSFGA